MTKNTKHNRGDKHLERKLVWWPFAGNRRPAFWAKTTRSGCHIVFFDGARGVRAMIDQLPDNGKLEPVDTTLPVTSLVKAYKAQGKAHGITKRALLLLDEALKHD